MAKVFIAIRVRPVWCGKVTRLYLPLKKIKKAKLLRLAWLYLGRVRTCAVTEQSSLVITCYNLHPHLHIPSITSCWVFPFSSSFSPSGAVTHEKQGITVVAAPRQDELCVSLLSMKRLWSFLNPERKTNKEIIQDVQCHWVPLKAVFLCIFLSLF